jgi:hypothetical protein
MEGDKCRDLPDKNSFVVNCDVEGSELGRNYTMCRILVQDGNIILSTLNVFGTGTLEMLAMISHTSLN